MSSDLSCSCLLCPQVSPQCPGRTATLGARARQKHKSLQGSLGVTGIVVIALWSSSPGRFCKSFTQISVALCSHLRGAQGTHSQCLTLPSCYSSVMGMVHPEFCQAWPTSSAWHPAGSQLLLASSARLWVTPHTTRACPETPECCFPGVGTECSSSKGSSSSECVGVLPVHATFK